MPTLLIFIQIFINPGNFYRLVKKKTFWNAHNPPTLGQKHCGNDLLSPIISTVWTRL